MPYIPYRQERCGPAPDGDRGALSGYQSCETFREVIKQITDGRLAEEYRKVAPVEIATNFDMSATEVDAIVESLRGQGLVRVVPVGNGRFIEPASDPLSCDPATGMSADRARLRSPDHRTPPIGRCHECPTYSSRSPRAVCISRTGS